MGSAQLKIKAKKISELDNFIDSHTITDNGEPNFGVQEM